ncbi:MAG: Uncharacterized protein LiPW15_206 [Parcubacteria group bacterium LiPW_15]|nr:MAG: Uncharacterized protein LiPW15_206 [Parcubacteria group bacterium LiPW_15]
MKKIWHSTKSWVWSHKIKAVVVAALVLFGGYYAYGKLNPTVTIPRYLVAEAAKTTVISSVTGTGQISAANQFDIKPKASGEVTYLPVSEGQTVKAGALILQIDSKDAAKAVRDAQASLDSAKIALEKLKQPADALSLLQAENALTQAKQNKQNTVTDLAKAYDDGFSAISNTFLDLPGVMTGLDSILNGYAIRQGQSNAYAYFDMIRDLKSNAEQFRTSALNSFTKAKAAYDLNFNDYKAASRYSDKTIIDSLINESYDTTKLISEAVKNTKNFLDLVNEALSNSANGTKPPATLTTHQSSLQTYTGTVNNDFSNLLNAKDSIKNDKDAITNADLSIAEKTESLAKLRAGTDPLDLKSQELAVTQRENALLDAKEELSNYYLRAPFDGVLADITVKKGDTVSPSTAAAIIITPTRVAEVTLNEVDVARVKVDQKATLTFDAFPDLTLIGKVAQVDAIGAVSQGVVNYTVKISFEAPNDNVKPGMSVSASIVTEVKTDVFAVPNSAVKTQGAAKYVEILPNVDASVFADSQNGQVTASSDAALERQVVSTGVEGDSYTEIIEGLSGGEAVVVRTVSASATSQTTGGTTSVRLPGVGVMSGGATPR